MAKNRMAGDALSAKEEGFRNSNERRLGTEEYDRLSGAGLQDADEGGRYSAKEVIAEMRNGRNGKTTEEMAEYYQGLADSGTKFNAKAMDFLSSRHGVTFGGGDGGEVETPTPTPDPTPTPSPSPEPPEITVPVKPPGLAPGPITGAPGGQTIVQDNDIVTSITGDGNSVINNQDNSINSSASSFAKNLRDRYVLNLTKSIGL